MLTRAYVLSPPPSPFHPPCPSLFLSMHLCAQLSLSLRSLTAFTEGCSSSNNNKNNTETMLLLTCQEQQQRQRQRQVHAQARAQSEPVCQAASHSQQGCYFCNCERFSPSARRDFAVWHIVEILNFNWVWQLLRTASWTEQSSRG